MFLCFCKGCGGCLTALCGQTWCSSQRVKDMSGNLVALSKLDVLACSVIHVAVLFACVCTCSHICQCM